MALFWFSLAGFMVLNATFNNIFFVRQDKFYGLLAIVLSCIMEDKQQERQNLQRY